MGFSLKTFFADLQAMLSDPDFRDDSARIEALKTFVENERKYAETCGQLR